MKRILALVNSYQTENDNLYKVVLEQVKCYSEKSSYILVHFIRHNSLDKKFTIKSEVLSDNLTTVTVDYQQAPPDSLMEKIRATLNFNNLVRMVAQVIMDDQEIDQVHLHESWPLVMLGRELSNVRKKPIFLFEYDKDYLYSSYRKRNKISLLPYFVVLFSAKSVQKIFAHSPMLIRRVSRNLNIKNKAVIIPLAVDEKIYNYDKSIENRKNLFVYFSERCDYNIRDVYEVIQNILSENPDYIAHFLVEETDIYETLLAQNNNKDIHIYNSLGDKKKAEILKSSIATIILDDDVQQLLMMNQALCCGSVIVTLKTISVSDELDENNSCMLFEKSDRALEEALNKAITMKYNHKNIAKIAKSKYCYFAVSNVIYREIRNY